MNTSVINIIIITLWLGAAIIDYAEYLYYWQLKWYMWSRYYDFLSTEQGSEFIFRRSFVLRTLIAGIVYVISLDNVPLLKYILIVFFIADISYLFGYRYMRRKFRRPVVTTKVLIILLLSLGVEATILVVTHNWHFVIVMLIIRIFIMGLCAMAMDVLTTFMKNNYYSRRAEKKLKQYKNLTVIGITGSYGKTTVKELVAQMLATKLKVIKTPKNTNSDIGISKFILNTDFSDADVFIVEMGAYVKGDIALHTNIAHPKIGILTAINSQHLTLMGTMKDIQNTKYELLRALPNDGLAIVNNDNDYCREYLSELTCDVLTFGTEDEYHPSLLITDLHQKKEGLHCKGTFEWKGEEHMGDLQTHLMGEHMAMNIAPAIIVASYLGFSKAEIQHGVTSLQNPENALHVYSYGKATIVDDSYNSNPDGFRAALQVMNQQGSEKKRIVVTRGMLELGDESDELHEQIGGEIAFVADELIIITPDFVAPLQRGVVSKYNTHVYVKTDPDDLVAYIKQFKNKDVVILLENRIPSVLRKELTTLS